MVEIHVRMERLVRLSGARGGGFNMDMPSNDLVTLPAKNMEYDDVIEWKHFPPY